ncbi:MAG: exo-alpha-sialidase [Rhodopirellula sp.]|nr:exo-alpha-sialidase [Rhodopirellula sp.]
MPSFLRRASRCLVLFLLIGTYADAATIHWNLDSLVQIEGPSGYGRIIRLQDDSLLAAYSRGLKTWVKKSADDGRTWGDRIVAGEAVYIATNAELLQLQNGTILHLFNDRPSNGVDPFAIRLAKSTDGGLTWSSPELVYQAGVTSGTGCWEPAAIQLPSGEIQLFFANEARYATTSEQEITMVRSYDNAATWTAPETVSFRAGHRDGMPVPLILADGQGIVVAIEDNGVTNNGTFKPSIIYTSMEDNWHLPYADGNSDRRWTAIEPPLDAGINAAAPYLAQLPSGETFLSVQDSEFGRRLMSVFVGDSLAQNFSDGTRPFEFMSDGAENLWCSLFAKDDQTVTAVAGIVKLDGTNLGLWAIDGHYAVPEPSTFTALAGAAAVAFAFGWSKRRKK